MSNFRQDLTKLKALYALPYYTPKLLSTKYKVYFIEYVIFIAIVCPSVRGVNLQAFASRLSSELADKEWHNYFIPPS